MQTTAIYYIKTVANAILISLGIAIFSFIIAAMTGRTLTWDQKMLQEFLYSVLMGFVLTVINSLFIDYINSKAQWIPGKDYYKIILAFSGSIPLTLFGIWLVRLIINVGVLKTSYQDFAKQQQFSDYFGPLVITFIVLLIFHTAHLYKKSQENKVKEQKIIAGNVSAQFESLKNQIDPHFLFNSLNVLSSLIEENPDNAQRFTTSLSKIYRYVLDQKDKELVSVREELDFAKTYMKLLAMRFENSLTYTLPEHGDFEEGKVVPLSLQLLLENTIKHNVVSDARPLHIYIKIEDGYLTVANNLQKKEVLNSGQGVGLKNIISRYAILTDKEVKINVTDHNFIVKIPILTKEISFLKNNKFNEMDAYYRAKKQVQDIKEFYTNLASYLFVIPILIFINYNTYWQFKWFVFPMAGWGIGLAVHAFTVFGYGRNWEERKIQEIMDRNQNNNNQKWI